MQEIISKLGSEEILGLCGIFVGMVAVLGGVAIAITGVISSNRRRAQRDEIEATLKLEMIERGMSAAEIKQILETHMGSHKCVNFAELLGSMKPPAAPKVFGAQPDKA
ncbi:MAG: hypothetical protein WDZ48_02780 [Pirellulales bacterium]